MRLRVDDITAESRELSFAEPEGELNCALSLGPIAEYVLVRPVAVEVSYYRAGTEVFLSGTVEAMARANCARCAEDFATSHARPFRYVLAPRSIGYDQESDLRGEDLEFSLYEGDHVDLAPLVREQVILALAERPLCREDCLGLCPRCGVNRNEATCDCRSETADSRLAVLRTLKVGRG
ncbi:MAG: YceD family protein [Candidatus Binataceae bacterium]